jgi:phosphate acetyltransferase
MAWFIRSSLRRCTGSSAAGELAAPVVSFLERLRTRAAARGRTVVFPESGDRRVLEAVRRVSAEGIARPVLLVDPATSEGAAATGADLRTVPPDFEPQLHSRVLEYAVQMVSAGEADACVAGAVHTTADVLRAGLRIVGPAPGVRTVSSAFYMVAGSPWAASSEVLTFTDCAVVPQPSAEQLSDIAIAAARDRRLIVGDDPRVAFLSFSTHGSATSDSIALVRNAVLLTRERAPGLLVDGELQADAALVPEICRRKAPGAVFEGDANVLVFPTLDAGNIAYKLVERLAGAAAIGPILQGLARPIADLSRGVDPDGIINVTAVAALQAGSD